MRLLSLRLGNYYCIWSLPLHHFFLPACGPKCVYQLQTATPTLFGEAVNPAGVDLCENYRGQVGIAVCFTVLANTNACLLFFI